MEADEFKKRCKIVLDGYIHQQRCEFKMPRKKKKKILLARKKFIKQFIKEFELK